MLKFFRSIRRRLLDSGRLRKYLVYALGEIILVVIGILIALQINNWNEDRKNQQTQFKYLMDIKNELAQNVDLMERLVLQRFDRKMEGLEKAKAYARGDYEVKDTIEFLSDVSFGAVFGNGIEFLSSSVFNELLNTGNLQLITNDSLKLTITQYYHFVDKQILNVRYYATDYQEFINSLRVFSRSNPNDFPPKDQQFMFQKLRSEETILMANQEMTYSNQVHYLVSGIHERAKKIMVAIEEELKK